MLQRKIYDNLLRWKNESQGSSALLIKGARRVGKSTLVREFAKHEYRSHIVIDFFQATDEVKGYFRDFSDNLDALFLYLSTYYKVDLYRRDSLIVFDEVQCFPFARGLLKYLVEDGRYDYIETGSLLSIRQNVQDIVIPSEEVSIELNPLDFEEYLWAKGERQLAELIRASHKALRPLPDGLHRRAEALLREYVLVGGMPKAVQEFVDKGSFNPADRVKREILDLYRSDVSRFARGYESKVVAVLNGIPGQLSKHEKRFQLSSLGKDARMRSYEESFLWLSDARIANLCLACTDPSVGLALTADAGAVKCYMADTGLLTTLAFSDNGNTGDDVYRAVLRGDICLNEGMLTENLIAQMLHANGHALYFYAQTGKGVAGVEGADEGDKRMEVDFLIVAPYPNAALKPRICPIEVKSPRQYGTISLDRFSKKFGKRVGTQYILSPKQLKVEGDRVWLPLYMGFCL